MKHYRTGWISDVHLGTKGSKAGQLITFLRDTEFEKLYLVGDLIDIWALRRGIYWPQEHNDVIQKLLRKGRKAPERGLRELPGAGQCSFLLGCDKTHPTKTHTHDQPH